MTADIAMFTNYVLSLLSRQQEKNCFEVVKAHTLEQPKGVLSVKCKAYPAVAGATHTL
jgi:hypothetical protein